MHTQTRSGLDCDEISTPLTLSGFESHPDKKYPPPKGEGLFFMAQRVGFEPTCGCPQTDFERGGEACFVMRSHLKLFETRCFNET